MHEPITRQVLLAGAVFWTAAAAQAQALAPAASPLDALPRSTLPEPAGIEVEVTPPAPPAAGLLATSLTPRRFDIEGVVSIPFEEVAALFTPLVGRAVTLGEVVERSQQATQLYQRRGYALSFFFVPQQDLRDGAVRVVAVEGHVQALQIDGDAGAAEPKLREIAERLRREKPLRRETFEHVTELLGRLPGLSLQAEVRLPTSTDGASTLLLKVRRKPYDVVVGLEARKPHPRAVLTGSVNDLIAPGSQLGASVLLSSARKDDYQTLHYQQFVGERGWSVKGTLSRYRGDPDEQLGLEGLLPRETRVNRAEIAASYPWFLSRSASWTLGLSLYGVDTRDTTSNPANGAYLSEDTRTRVLQAQIAHAQHQATRSRQASLTLSHGLRALGASAAYLSNVPGLAGPSPVTLGFARLQAEAAQADRFANGFGTAVSLALQYSPHLLPSSEKVSFGGSRFGRGYAGGEAVGDSGWGLGLELNKAFKADGGWLRQWQPYVLLEAARVHLRQGRPMPQRLRSVSLGLRLSDHQRYSLDIAVSKPTGDASLSNPDRDWRASLLYSYRLGGG
jgi:hemolysin activation/secretion protein